MATQIFFNLNGSSVSYSFEQKPNSQCVAQVSFFRNPQRVSLSEMVFNDTENINDSDDFDASPDGVVSEIQRMEKCCYGASQDPRMQGASVLRYENVRAI